MIIINEYEYVKEIIETKVIPKDVSNKRLLTYIAKYYYNEDLKATQYKNLVFSKMKEFNLSIEVYQEYKYDSFVKNLCEKIISGEISPELRKIESIELYQSELDIIKQGENDRERKLLFTMFVLAKINGTNSGWVNNDLKDIFQLANITATTKDRALMIHKLYKAGLVEQNHKNDTLGYKVELGNNTEPMVMTVDSFKHLGNQYIAKFKAGYKMCENCGKPVKIKGNRQKYCKRCYEQINATDAKNRMKKLRENENVTF